MILAAGELPERGFVRQEQVDLDRFLANRFGRTYDSRLSSRFTRAVAPEEERDALAPDDADATWCAARGDHGRKPCTHDPARVDQ